MAATLLKVSAKVGIPLGAVYYTSTNDIWATESAKTQNTALQLKDYVLTETQLEKDSVSKLSSWATSSYNSAVKTVFNGVLKTPDVAVTLSKDAGSYVKSGLTDAKSYVKTFSDSGNQTKSPDVKS